MNFSKEAIIEKLKWIRRSYYRRRYRLHNVDRKFLATKGLMSVSHDLKAGAYTYIGPNCMIYPNVIIGKYTMLASDVYIIGGDHNYRTPGIPSVFNGRDMPQKTIIGDDVWIGSKSIIMCGVKIGNGAIIAAGSVVTKDVEPYAIYGGIPAKKIRMRFSAEEIQLHESILNLPVSELEKRGYKLASGKEIWKTL